MNKLTWNVAHTKTIENKKVREIVDTFLRDRNFYNLH